MQLLPAVDILGGRIVRLHRGNYQHVTEYGDDVAAQAIRWRDQGASLVHIVDLDGARTGTPALGVWREVAEAGVPFQVGGGIRSVEDAVGAIAAGATRVMMGTSAVWEPEVLAAAVDRLGPSAVMASIDVLDGNARGSGWLDGGRLLEDVVANCVEAGIERFLVTAVAKDGTMQGPDLGLFRRVAELAPGIALVAAGGISAIGHLVRLADAGLEGAVVGRALYEGGFTLEDAIRKIG